MAWTHRSCIAQLLALLVTFLVKTQSLLPLLIAVEQVKVFHCIQPLSISTPVLPGRALPTYSQTLYSCVYMHFGFDPVQLGASQCYQPEAWMSLCFSGYTSLEWVLTDSSVHFGMQDFPMVLSPWHGRVFLLVGGYAISLFYPLNTGSITYITVGKKNQHKNYLSSSIKSLCCAPIHSLCVPVTFSYYLHKKIICPVKSSVAPLIRSNYVWK